MAKLSRQAGTTSQILLVHLQHNRSLAGSGIAGLSYNSQNLQLYYKRNTASASVAVALVDIATLGTYVSGGFREVDATHCPGLYELHVPDAALATGADTVVFVLQGYINLVPKRIEIELTATNNQDGIRGGMTALPAAAAGSTGGLPTVDGNNSVRVQSTMKKGQALGFPFQMLDSSGAPVTSATVAAQISKDDAAFANTTNTASELGNGWYWLSLTAAETNCSALVLHATASGASNTDLTLLMVP